MNMDMNDMKQHVIESIDWIEKSPCITRKSDESADIMISLRSSDNGKRRGIAVTFRNGSMERIAPSLRISVGIIKNRMYFKENAESGYKISIQRTGNPAVKFSKHYEKFLPFVGEYELEFDELLDMYYIKKEDEK